uniref:WxxW domain-containing protein n=1 Tax=Amphilophus citrinellus TaxID=61819 RepID=A0A3Q0RS92_AMPCI
TVSKCWTKWFDRDDPSATGDWETLSSLHKENPGKICPRPTAIEAKTLSGLSVAEAGEVIYKNDTTSGFICRNKDQIKDKKCSDYRVRFSCHPPFCGGGEKTSFKMLLWFCSFLTAMLSLFHCSLQCSEAVTTDTMTPAIYTGETFFIYNPTQEFACSNEDQTTGMCRDYKVCFGCPCGD